ncbi:MAG: arsenate reductase ArsC [Magnetococcales bacterium]|nr:arsenate reductase ArsC [Magnetococcales bacterium]
MPLFNVLFLCTHNSARSIMAEALLNHWARGRVRAFSAGSSPSGTIHPLALRWLHTRDVALEGLRSKSWEAFAQPGAPGMKMVITVCDGAAGEVCPIWPGGPMKAHWGVPEPGALAAGREEGEGLEVFARIGGVLEHRIRRMLDAPLETMDGAALKALLDAIGRMA